MKYFGDQKSNIFLYYTSLLISLFGSTSLSIESYLSLKGQSLCHTDACAIVSRYLTINESILVAAGAILLWLVTFLIFFSKKYPTRCRNLVYFLIFLSLSFDGTLIGFQFFTIQQKCAICISFALVLVLVSISFGLANKHYALTVCLFCSWLGAFSANSILDVPEPSNAYAQMAFLSTKPATEPTKMVATLIFSMQCPHCFEIIELLEDKHNANPDLSWRFAITDKDADSLHKATSFIMEIESYSNPFSLLKTIKNRKYAPDQIEIDKNLLAHSKKSLSFLSNSGVNIIPTLVIEKNQRHKIILVGIGQISSFIDTLNN